MVFELKKIVVLISVIIFISNQIEFLIAIILIKLLLKFFKKKNKNFYKFYYRNHFNFYIQSNIILI